MHDNGAGDVADVFETDFSGRTRYTGRLYNETDLDLSGDELENHPAIQEIRDEVIKKARTSSEPSKEYHAYSSAYRSYHTFVSATNKYDSEEDFEIWSHKSYATSVDKVDGEPYVNKREIEQAVVLYINQKIRSAKFDRLLLDALIGSTIFDFIDAVAVKKNKPIMDFFNFAFNLVLIAFLLWITNGATWAKIVSAYLLIGPFTVGPMIRKNLQPYRKRMRSMRDAYRTLDGPIASLAEVRRAVEAARDKGAVWPTSLWVLLDDIQARRPSV